MPEIGDKLTHHERLRLECLAQAVALNTMGGSKQAQPVVAQAAAFEQFVRGPEAVPRDPGCGHDECQNLMRCVRRPEEASGA